MISELRLPAGEKGEERKGGQTSLRDLLDTIKKGEFTGYFRTVLTLEGDASSGVLVFDRGSPTVALYSFKPAGTNSVEMMYRGERAAEFTLGDSIFPDTSISLTTVSDHDALSALIEDYRQDRSPDLTEFIMHFYRDNLSAEKVGEGLDEVASILELKQAIMKYHREKSLELSSKRGLKDVELELDDGESYLVEELTRDFSHGIFVAYLAKGYAGLAISRTNPRMLRRSYNEIDAELIWLTDHESEAERTIAPSLEKIVVVLEEFMLRKERCIILIDDLQYLISSNSFEGALRFIRSLVDRISERSALFLLSIDPASLSLQERSILEREMRLVRER
ncbi:MAG: DUF835 domain-containing protein [Methanomassiliicoccales archaeon]|nr:DUF835 domain-containing protein [Methanomassiliicoccales archaeon]